MAAPLSTHDHIVYSTGVNLLVWILMKVDTYSVFAHTHI